MSQVSLSQQFSLNAIEGVLREVRASPGQDLPVTKDYASKRHGPLRDAARLQLLATWARTSPGKRLVFSAQNSTASVLDEWCEYAPGLVGLRMSEGIIVGEQPIERRDALVPALSKMEHTSQLELRSIVRGRVVDFPCVSGADRQYLSALFTEKDPRAVKGKQAMFEELMRLSVFVAQTDRVNIDPSFMDACALFSTELMKNTQEHAIADARGKPYLAHVEGLILGWNEMSARVFRDDFTGHPDLNAFWEREEVELGQGDRGLRSIQISFFDTGPGFVGRLLGADSENLGIEEEREIVLAGLRKHATSKRETGAGNGIPEVLAKLRQIGGLITIRTGRLRIFRAFSPGEDADLFDFKDWSASRLSEAAGAVVTIIMPIRRA